MPPVIVAAVVVAGALIGGATLGTALLFGGLSIGAGFLSQALAPKIKRPSIPVLTTVARDRTTLIRSSIAPHRIIYGNAQVSGPIVAAFSTGATNEFLHLVIPLAGHQVNIIGDTFFNDINSIDPRFSGLVRINRHLGSEEQAADTDLVAEVTEWTTAHRLRGIAYVYVRLKWDQNVWVTGIPNIKVGVLGKKLWDIRATSVALTSSSVANPTVITTGSVHGLSVEDQVHITGHTGSVPGINGEYEVLSVPTTTTFTIRVNVTTGGTSGDVYTNLWTPNASLIALDYLKGPLGIMPAPTGDGKIESASWQAAANISEEQVTLQDDAETFTVSDLGTDLILLGLPGVPLDWGDIVRLTTTGTLPAGLATGTDYYVSLTGRTHTYRLSTTLANAFAIVAVDITDLGTGTHTITRKSQMRYGAHGVVFTDQRPIDIMEDLLTASSGTMVFQQGKYRGYAGAFTTPSIILDEDDLRGDMRVQTKPSRADTFNAVRGIFIDQFDFFQGKDFPPVTNATYEAEDGRRLFEDIELPFTTDIVRAQRLAKIALERQRQGISGTYPAQLSALELATWDTVKITNAKLGYSQKEFRIITWGLAEDGGVDLTLQETASAIYDWNAGEETVIDLAPNTNLPRRRLATVTHNFRNLVLITHRDSDKKDTQISLERASEVVFDNGERVDDWSNLIADITQSGAGGLDTGSPINSRWYRILAIWNPSTLTRNLMLHLEKVKEKDQEQAQQAAGGQTKLRDATARTRIAQGFKLSKNADVRWIASNPARVATPSGNIWITIEADSSGVPSGTPLATSDKLKITPGINTSNNNWRMFLFRNPASLISGTQYWIVFYGDFTISGTDHILYGGSSSNPYADGVAAEFDGTTWTTVSGRDLAFQVHIFAGEASVTLPSGYTNFATIGYVFRQSDGTFKEFMAENKSVVFNTPIADYKVGDFGVTHDIVDIAAFVPPVPVMFLVAGSNSLADGTNRVGPAPEGYTINDPASESAQIIQFSVATTTDVPFNPHGSIHIEDHQSCYALTPDVAQNFRFYIPGWDWL